MYRRYSPGGRKHSESDGGVVAIPSTDEAAAFTLSPFIVLFSQIYAGYDSVLTSCVVLLSTRTGQSLRMPITKHVKNATCSQKLLFILCRNAQVIPHHYVHRHNNALKVLFYHLCYQFKLHSEHKPWYNSDTSFRKQFV